MGRECCLCAAKNMFSSLRGGGGEGGEGEGGASWLKMIN